MTFLDYIGLGIAALLLGLAVSIWFIKPEREKNMTEWK